MGRVLMTGGGGGADLDVITAAADDVLSGKVIVDKDGNPLTGTLTLSGNAGAADVLSGKTFYTTNPKSKQTGTMGTLAGGTYTPSTSQQTISCSGKKMTSNVIIKGDSNLVAGNILNGKSIFGVTGNVRKVAKLTKQYSTNGSGTFTCNGNNGSSYLPYLTVSGFGFTPAAVIATVWASSGLQLTACDGSNYAVHSTGYNYMINSGAAKFAYNNLVIPVGSSGTHWVNLYGYY